MNAVERVLEYTDTIPVERPFEIPATQPPPEWPQAGRIEFDRVEFSYREGLPPVINDVSLTIEGGM